MKGRQPHRHQDQPRHPRPRALTPIVLVSYDIVCPAYKDTKQAEFAKAWLTYVTSDEGQKAAQDAAGTAPLPSSLKSEITKSIEAIKTK